MSHVDRKQSLATVDTVHTAVQANYLAVAPGEVKAIVVCNTHITVLVLEVAWETSHKSWSGLDMVSTSRFLMELLPHE